jgi:hypothetical protein
MVLAGAIVAAFGFERAGVAGVVGAVIATSICWAASSAAILVTSRFCQTSQAVTGVFGGMLLRTGVPMAAAIVISQNSPTLAKAGVFGEFVILFLIALAVETWLSVAIVNASSRAGRGPASPVASR